jgi:hypothetical protein
MNNPKNIYVTEELLRSRDIPLGDVQRPPQNAEHYHITYFTNEIPRMEQNNTHLTVQIPNLDPPVTLHAYYKLVGPTTEGTVLRGEGPTGSQVFVPRGESEINFPELPAVPNNPSATQDVGPGIRTGSQVFGSLFRGESEHEEGGGAATAAATSNIPPAQSQQEAQTEAFTSASRPRALSLTQSETQAFTAASGEEGRGAITPIGSEESSSSFFSFRPGGITQREAEEASAEDEGNQPGRRVPVQNPDPDVQPGDSPPVEYSDSTIRRATERRRPVRGVPPGRRVPVQNPDPEVQPGQEDILGPSPTLSLDGGRKNKRSRKNRRKGRKNKRRNTQKKNSRRLHKN